VLVTSAILGYQPGSFVVPDGVEGDLQLPVVEAAIVAGDDDVDLRGVFGHPDAREVEGPLIPRPQLLHQAPGAGQQVMAQVDGAVEVEDVGLVEAGRHHDRRAR
jgi:hypothetical protein